jgi:hypothetical protein
LVVNEKTDKTAIRNLPREVLPVGGGTA